MLDRVEIRVGISPPKIEEMGRSCVLKTTEEKSRTIARRVKAAVEIQQHRYKKIKIRRNALIPAGLAFEICPMNEKAEKAFHTAIEKLGLSGRAYHGILRVARTIADLEGKDTIEIEHILEAVQHRRLGDDPWDILM